MPVLAPRPPRNDPAARLAALRKLARSHGGRCLSPEYLGVEVKLEFECRHGHRFTASPDRVFVGSWCAECRLRGPDKQSWCPDCARERAREAARSAAKDNR